MKIPESLQPNSEPESHSEIPQPDFDRWPEVGYPPISGGSGQPVELRPSLIGRIVDTLLPTALPHDLYRKMDKVMEPYKKVLEGAITNPEEVERIRREFNEWFQEVLDHLKR